MKSHYRQGDVLLVKLMHFAPDKLPGTRNVPRVNGRVILALGELTGHAHAIDSSLADLFEDRDGQLYLRVQDGCDVLHEEHDPIHLAKGLYQVVRQRQYAPGTGTRTVRVDD